MTSPAPSRLSESALTILKEMCAATQAGKKGVEAASYRARHEHQRNLLDDLERKGYLRKDYSQRYWVSLSGLAEIGAQSKPIFARCDRLFTILKKRYKLHPQTAISVSQLSRQAKLSLHNTALCLNYMVEASCWGGYSTNFEVDGANITSGESILDYKTFHDVVEEAKINRTTRERTDFRCSGFMEKTMRQFDSLNQPAFTPSDAVAAAILLRIDAEHVSDAWQKALDRRAADPEGAITAARSLLETVCKFILDEEHVMYSDTIDLPGLYQLTANKLRLGPSQHTEQIFKRVLGSCQNVVVGLGALRNKLSDSHGKSKQAVKPAARHAELAVNLAGTMATFLVATWDARKEP
jgi:hypothetical protein